MDRAALREPGPNSEFPDLERKFPDTPIKFPVPIPGEFVANALISRIVPASFPAKIAHFRENSLFFPCLINREFGA